MCFFLVIFLNIVLSGHFTSGIHDEKGVVFGLWDPSAFLTFTDIPTDSRSFYRSINLKLQNADNTIISITSDPSHETLFFIMNNNIYIYQNFSIWQNRSWIFPRLFSGRSFAYGQLAFDHVSSNIYWCDALLSWIVMRPAYSFDEMMYKVVVHNDLNTPLGLALDPEDGLMFFADNWPTRIERASLNGQDRVVIVYRGLLTVKSLSVDTLKNKLYWADEARQTLEVSDYDGSNRKVIRRLDDKPTDFYYYQNLLYVISAKKQEMFTIDAYSGLQLFSEDIYYGQPQAIHVYDAITKRTTQDPCVDLDCDHMCLNTKPEPKCLCADGYILDDDEETCIEKFTFYERGFLVSNESMFAIHEVHSVNGREKRRFLKMQSYVETFAVDAKSDYIYFLDSKNKFLKKLDMISTLSSTLAIIPSGKGLIFDWLTNRLAWIESVSSIMSFSIKFGMTSRIYSKLQHLDSLTINSHSGTLYWISGPIGSRSIVYGTWEKDPPTVLISEANLDNPVSLQYDVTSNRLYWLDGSQIKSSKANGLDITSHHFAMGATKVFPYKHFLGWISRDQIHFKRKSLTSTTSEFIFNTVQSAKNVVVFDSSLQKDKRGTCHILNGGCEDICVPTTSGRKCECDIGQEIQKDNTCYSDQLMRNFIIVTDPFHGRILQIDLQTGSVVKIPITATASGVAFDKSSQTILYSDIVNKTIMSTTLYGKNTSILFSSGFSYARHLAIDFSTGNIFFSALGKEILSNYIGVVHSSSIFHKEVVYLINPPRAITVHPSKGFLFWVEPSGTPAIGRSYMDGKGKVYIIAENLKRPNGLTIDYTSNQLFWTDGETSRIEFSNLDGGNRQVLATDTAAEPLSIGIHGQYLYYTASNRQRITKMDKTTGLKVPFMNPIPELGEVQGMDIFADEYMDVSSSCSHKNGMCSTFCFPTPMGRTCGCQNNVYLQTDQLTCQGVTRCPTELPNVKFLDCPPYPGQSCDFECKPGYRSNLGKTVSCLSGGQWELPVTAICEAIQCPLSLENAVLSSECSRRPGDSCSFSCAQGYRPSSLDKIVCTNEGTWNADITTLCSISGCPKIIENGRLRNCQYKIGESCRYECNDQFDINPLVPYVVCDSNGVWNHDTSELCVKMCPSSIKNGHLTPDCRRHIGDRCSFTCDAKYRATIKPTTIVCTTGGVWDRDAHELCVEIKCPLEIPFGRLSSVCRGLVGEICALNCDDETMERVHVVCSSTGFWDKDISTICTARKRKQPKDISDNNIYMYVGALAVGALVIIMFCQQNRRH